MAIFNPELTGANDGTATMTKGNDQKSFTNRVSAQSPQVGCGWRHRLNHVLRSLTVVATVVILTTVNAHTVWADDDEDIAVSQALEWLSIIDNADYPGSFAAMSGVFTIGVRENVWQKRISALRGPLGLVKSRLLESAEAASNIQGAPAGDYFIVHFTTVFESEPSITEAVTMYKQDDGIWKSAGYYVSKSE